MPIDLDTLNGPQRQAVECTEGPLAGAGGRRIGQDARADLPHRAPHRRPGRGAVGDPGHHVHQQGGSRDARAPRRARGSGARPRHVGVHVPQHVRAHAARRRRAPGLSRATSPSTTPTTQKRLYKEIMAELDIDPKRFPVNALHEPHLHGEKRADRARRLRQAGQRPGGQGRRTRLRAPAGAPEGAPTRSTSTTCCSTPTCC